METKANYAIVGAFTVLVFLAAFAFVYWIARVGNVNDAADLDIVIEGSVTGLGVGSPVKFNGIDVGKVTALSFDPNNPRVVIARSRVSSSLPITKTTKAVLGFTGLTGVAHIEFEGSDVNSPTVFEIAQQEGTVATVTADPSAVNNLLATAQDIFNRTDSVLNELEGFVADARGPLTKTLENTSKVTDALAENSDKVETFLVAMGDLGKTLEGASGNLNKLLDGANNIITSVDPEQVKGMVADVKQFTTTLSTIGEDFDGITESARKTLAGLEDTGGRISSTLEQVDTLLKSVPPDSINKAVTSFADAGEAAKKAAEGVSTLTTDLSAKREDITGIVDDVAEMAERLNAASVRVDGVLAKLDGFLGEGDSGALFEDARQTLASFKRVADTLNSRLDGITAGLERFSGRGLQNVETLVNDTRRSINRIESAISSLERDPQRLLFGGEGDVKRFDGRQRR